jgi:hypothetical protein
MSGMLFSLQHIETVTNMPLPVMCHCHFLIHSVSNVWRSHHSKEPTGTIWPCCWLHHCSTQTQCEQGKMPYHVQNKTTCAAKAVLHCACLAFECLSSETWCKQCCQLLCLHNPSALWQHVAVCTRQPFTLPLWQPPSGSPPDNSVTGITCFVGHCFEAYITGYSHLLCASTCKGSPNCP